MVSKRSGSGNGSRVMARALGRTVAVGACLLALILPAMGLGGQEGSPGADAYLDPPAARLVERARQARTVALQELGAYEAVLEERLRLGLTGGDGSRRPRDLVRQARIARIAWTEGGVRAVQWLGARRAVPVLGTDAGLGRTAAERETLLAAASVPPMALEPAGSGPLVFGRRTMVDPLADGGSLHYRYSSGDTLRMDGGPVLVEVRVQPRRTEARLVAASLWFDAETAALVRAAYRPARAVTFAVDRPTDRSTILGLLGPFSAEIRRVTVDYSLHEDRFWLPRSVTLEGEGRVAVAIPTPLRVEWRVGDYRVDEGAGLLGDGPLPVGWSRRAASPDRDGAHATTVLLPPADSLWDSNDPRLSFERESEPAFTEDEAAGLDTELDDLLPGRAPYRPDLAWGLDPELVRFNRVEGLSVGLSSSLHLSPLTRAHLTGRFGTADRRLSGSFGLSHGAPARLWRVRVYEELRSMNDWEDPFSLPSSGVNVLLGSDRGQYVRVGGASVSWSRRDDHQYVQVEAFGERQRGVTLNTEFRLFPELGTDTATRVLQADEVTIGGLRGRWAGHRDVVASAARLTGEVRGELARADGWYGRASVTGAAAHPLSARLTGAVEVSAGAGWGEDLPLQREYFLGGSGTLRGFHTNERHGESFWRARSEIATRSPGLRLVGFADVGWVGPRARFDDRAFDADAILAGVGAGVSLLDGAVRADLARAVRGGRGWSVHFFLDGLL